MTDRMCTACGAKRGLDADDRCKDKAACLRRVTATMVTKPYVGGFDPEQAYRDAPKGQAA